MNQETPPPGSSGGNADVLPVYIDVDGQWQESPANARTQIAAAIETKCRAAKAPGHRPHVVRPGQSLPLPVGSRLRLEDGAVLAGLDATPLDLPFGYHHVERDDREPTLLIATPGKCYFPSDLRTWGWSAQLYALRSSRSWGIGDLADLRVLGQWAAEQGASFLLLNPLGADTPALPQEPSPYSPSSQSFLNPLCVAIEEIPGASDDPDHSQAAIVAGRALNADPSIDRDRVFALKSEALRRLWSRFGGDSAFEAFIQERGELLMKFCTFSAIAELHGRDWRKWPHELHHPSFSAIAEFVRRHPDAVRFHAWSQWILDRQLAAAAKPVALVQDLAVGFSPSGADAWIWQDALATDFAVGVPGDRYNPAGQNWELPPFVPACLAAANYQPWIETVRALLRHAGGLRIDHVMGLFRMYWIPPGNPPTEGAFVRYPSEDLLAILALESHRARATIVGEDLGTLEPGVPERLEAHNLLSYRLLWFDDVAAFPPASLGAVTTHDLPTIAGAWTGQDIKDRSAAGLAASAGDLHFHERLKALGCPADASPADAIRAIHALLAASPSAMVAATLEDALTVEHRPNMPGPTRNWPNWSRALPLPLDALFAQTLPRAIAAAMQIGRQSSNRSREQPQ